MKVLLLNPPGRTTYIRDYFCSKTTKSNYLFHPIDLVVLSGTLASEHEVGVLDAMAERLDPAAAHARIARFGPAVVVALVGAVSWEEDRAFLADVARSGVRVLALGDVLQEHAEPSKRADRGLYRVVLDHPGDLFPDLLRVVLLDDDGELLTGLTQREPVARRHLLQRHPDLGVGLRGLQVHPLVAEGAGKSACSAVAGGRAVDRGRAALARATARATTARRRRRW